ncbi:hypothetical protein H2248_005420 [Termitomyces sp. 'cryptogamus']|nr:hypothetical protein H2248_005420 [Termitomyces sp. 'cryptogamus']
MMLGSRSVALAMDSHVYPSKTPGRMKSRNENAVPMTIHAKRKEIMTQTPFPAGKQAYQKGAVAAPAQGKQIVSRPARIQLGDKTPFPNRSNTEKPETPASQLSKLPIISFLGPQSRLQLDKTPESLRRPSSARSQDRVPRNANKPFVTPVNNGNHWDASELCITPPEVEAQEPRLPEDDFDEIEYMPPNTLHLALEPVVDIELPDYRELGKALFEFAHTCPIDDTPVAEIEINGKDLQLPGWDLLPIPELESDDPFQRSRKPKSATAHIRSKTILPTKQKQMAPPTNKMLVKPLPPPALRPKSTTSLRSEPSASTLNPKKESSLRPTSSIRGAPIKRFVPSTSRTAKPNPPTVNKAKIIDASRPIKPTSQATRSIATSAVTCSRPSSTSSMILRRPTASTSHHKALPGSRKASSSSNLNKDEADVIPLVVEPGLDEDFRFDV